MTDLPILDLIQVALWFLAGAISLYFSIGSARIWTSISTGFFLIFLSEGYRVAPWVEDPRLAAIHFIVGTIAILVMTFGFQEYYVFSRTFEAEGRKARVYLTTLAAIAASLVFLLINPPPSDTVLRHVLMVANVNWVFLSLINLDMIRRIYRQIGESRVAPGFIAFGVAFFFLFLWRGSELYLQVYCWDATWNEHLRQLGAAPDAAHAGRIAFSRWVHEGAGLLSSVSVGATFLYLLRLLR